MAVEFDPQRLKRAGTLLFLGAGQFTLFFVLAEVYYPGYDVSSQAISDLGATCGGEACKFVQPSSDIFNVSIILLGFLVLWAAYNVWAGQNSTRALPFFMVLAALGAIGVGTFNETFGGVHVFFSALTFVAAGIEALLVYKVARPPFSWFSAVLGFVTLVATVLYASGNYMGLGQGGMERMVVWPALVGTIALGGYLMSLGDFYLR